MPFYKKDGDELLTAPNAVHAPNIYLSAEQKDQYAYPVEGWYWFDNLDLAMAFFAAQQGGNSVTMRQARLALLQYGMLASVDAAIDSMSEPQRTAAKIEWDYSSEVLRDSPLVVQLSAALGLTEQQMDDLFAFAKTL